MKLLFIVLLTTFATLISTIDASGQNRFRKLNHEFSSEKALKSAELNKRTIKYYLKEDNPSREVRKFIKEIDKINLLSFYPGNNDYYNKVNQTYNLNEFLLMSHQSYRNKQKWLFVKEDDDGISQLLLFSLSNMRFTFVEMQGSIDLDALESIADELNFSGISTLMQDFKKGEVTSNEKPENTNPATHAEGKVKVYDSKGNKLLTDESDPAIYVNGLQAGNGDAIFKEIPSGCIERVAVQKKNKMQGNEQATIDIELKGGCNTPYVICKGVLFFGEDGQLYSFKIDDQFSPNLLMDCEEKPLWQILEMNPEKVKSIKLAVNPDHCKGVKQGQYVVVHQKID